MAITPAELVLVRNDIAKQVVERLTSTASASQSAPAAARTARPNRRRSGTRVEDQPATTEAPAAQSTTLSAKFTPTGTMDNMYQAVARVDLGDGFYVDVLVQPSMDGDPQTFSS